MSWGMRRHGEARIADEGEARRPRAADGRSRRSGDVRMASYETSNRAGARQRRRIEVVPFETSTDKYRH